mgnify:CR=1 FL=1
MEGLGEAFIVVVLFVGIIIGISECDNCATEHDKNIKKIHDSYVSACFPLIFDKEIEIDENKYVICHTEPGSKDFKIKEFVK